MSNIQTESQNLTSLTNQTGALLTWATGLVIGSVDERDKAILNLKEIKAAIKIVEDDKEQVYRPIKAALDSVVAKYKPLLKTLEDAELTVRRKVTAFEEQRLAAERKVQEAERRQREEEALRVAQERERALQEEIARAEAEADARAAELKAQGQPHLAEAVLEQAAIGVQAMQQVVEKATDNEFAAASHQMEVAKTVQAAGAAFTTRMVWSYRLVDIKQVPANFLVLDQAAVRAAIRSGERKIDGLEIFQEAQGSLR